MSPSWRSGWKHVRTVRLALHQHRHSSLRNTFTLVFIDSNTSKRVKTCILLFEDYMLRLQEVSDLYEWIKQTEYNVLVSEFAVRGFCYLWTEPDEQFPPVSSLYTELSQPAAGLLFQHFSLLNNTLTVHCIVYHIFTVCFCIHIVK